MTDSVYWIWLQLMFGVGSRRSQLFLQLQQDPQLIYQEIKSGGPLARHLRENEQGLCDVVMEQAVGIQRRTLRKGCDIITPDHPLYPPDLQQVYAKPAVLYVKGDLSCLQQGLAIAMVGTRKHSDYGKQVAHTLAGRLAQNGVTVVSGLARGIDTICHQAALEARGKTVGILGCSLDVDYPKGSAELKRAMVQNGAVVSEYPLGTPPNRSNFPIRNRIISGMSRGVVVVEADVHSGSIITAGHALEQGRDVFAVPGEIFSATVRGSHALIKDGAKLVDSVEDILEEYGTPPRQNILPLLYNPLGDGATLKEMDSPPSQQRLPQTLPPDLSGEAKEIYQMLSEQPAVIEDIIAGCALEVSKLHIALTELELFGLIRGLPGRRFVRITPQNFGG